MRLRILQVRRIEAFDEPAVDQRQQVMGVTPLAPIGPKPGKIASGSKLEDARRSMAGVGQCGVESGLGSPPAARGPGWSNTSSIAVPASPDLASPGARRCARPASRRLELREGPGATGKATRPPSKGPNWRGVHRTINPIASAFTMSMKKAETRGRIMNARAQAPWSFVTAVMLAMAVGVAPRLMPVKPDEITAAS